MIVSKNDILKCDWPDCDSTGEMQRPEFRVPNKLDCMPKGWALVFFNEYAVVELHLCPKHAEKIGAECRRVK